MDITKRVMEITNGEGVKCVVDGIGKVCRSTLSPAQYPVSCFIA